MTFYINEKERHASSRLGTLLGKCIDSHNRIWNELIFLCIGSDRITGDSLGPLIGHRLERFCLPCTFIYGTLQYPVHALNLEETMQEIHRQHAHPLIIAIDASLGSRQHLGYITLGNGSLAPGAGVHKTLPSVGDIFITGIVNQSGTFQHFMLQTTRLSTIVSLADTITEGILLAHSSYFEENLRLEGRPAFFQEREGRRRSWTKEASLGN